MFDDDRLCRGDVGGVKTEAVGYPFDDLESATGVLVGVEGGVLQVLLRSEGLLIAVIMF